MLNPASSQCLREEGQGTAQVMTILQNHVNIRNTWKAKDTREPAKIFLFMNISIVLSQKRSRDMEKFTYSMAAMISLGASGI